MSLTNMLSSKENFAKDFKKIVSFITPKSYEFKTISEKTAFSKEYVIQAPYELQFPIEARLVGVAFDYLARFILSRYTNSKLDESDLYCRHALNVISEQRVRDKYQRHINIMRNFEVGNATNSDVMASMTFFAQLEYIARTGEFDQKLYDSLYRTPNESVFNDLRKQGNLFYLKFIQSQLVKPNSIITYNPNFGEELSKAVGGIDADLCIDGVLYDLKTTKSIGYSKNYAIQIMAYFLFHLLDKLMYDKTELQSHPINRIALYKARFGEIEYFDISNIPHRLMTETLINLNAHFHLNINNARIRDLTSNMLKADSLKADE